MRCAGYACDQKEGQQARRVQVAEKQDKVRSRQRSSITTERSRVSLVEVCVLMMGGKNDGKKRCEWIVVVWTLEWGWVKNEVKRPVGKLGSKSQALSRSAHTSPHPIIWSKLVEGFRWAESRGGGAAVVVVVVVVLSYVLYRVLTDYYGALLRR